MANWLLGILSAILNPVVSLFRFILISIGSMFVSAILVISFNWTLSLSSTMVSSSIANQLYGAFFSIGLALLGLSTLIFLFKCIVKYVDSDGIDIYKASVHIVGGVFALFTMQRLVLFAYYFSSFIANNLQNRFFNFSEITFELFNLANEGLVDAIFLMAILPPIAKDAVLFLVLLIMVYVLITACKITFQIGIRAISFMVCVLGGYFAICYFMLGETNALKKFVSQVLHLSIVEILQTVLYFLGVYLLLGNVNEMDILAQWFFASCTFYTASNIHGLISAIGFDGADASRGSLATMFATVKTTVGLMRQFRTLVNDSVKSN